MIHFLGILSAVLGSSYVISHSLSVSGGKVVKSLAKALKHSLPLRAYSHEVLSVPVRCRSISCHDMPRVGVLMKEIPSVYAIQDQEGGGVFDLDSTTALEESAGSAVEGDGMRDSASTSFALVQSRLRPLCFPKTPAPLRSSNFLVKRCSIPAMATGLSVY